MSPTSAWALRNLRKPHAPDLAGALAALQRVPGRRPKFFSQRLGDNAQPRSSQGPGRAPRSPSTPRRGWRMRCVTGAPCLRARQGLLPRRAGWSSLTASARSPAPDPPRRGRANALTLAAPYAALHPSLSEICPPCPCPHPRIRATTESRLRFVGQAGGICFRRAPAWATIAAPTGFGFEA
jgi:hypothetical protein